MSAKVRVAVRVRPQNERERVDCGSICVAVSLPERTITVGRDKQFTYNYVLGPNTQQDELYEACVRDPRRDRDLIKGVFDGYNATVLAYGQTGCGKTYTMGTAWDTNEQTMGIISRAARDIFEEIDERKYAAYEQHTREPEFDLSVQFIELYNEEIIDLLATEPSAGKIDIREGLDEEVCMRGVVTRQVDSERKVHDLLRAGIVNRSTASTNMNEKSSRSHAIFTITLKQRRLAEGDPNQLEMLSAKFHFVDLAGSEGLKKTGATGDRAREGIHINKGLLDLGNVISALHEHAQYIPYRNGKLTQLLRDSLGGNSRTLMIACVSPSELDITETVKTLNYAQRAMSIRNKQARHFRLVSNQNIGDSAGAVDPADSMIGGSSSTIAIPPLPDADTFPYSSSQWVGWYRELGRHLPNASTDRNDVISGEDMEFIESATTGDDHSQLPLLLGSPDDIEGIARIRKLFTDQIARNKGHNEALAENAKLFDAKLKQRLCLADLDRTRVEVLETELRNTKGVLSTRTRENRSLKRKCLALEGRVCTYEAQLDDARLKEERAMRYIDQERAPDRDARRTLQNLAKMFESPVPTRDNVARLRKKFGGEEDDDCSEDDDGGATHRKTPKLIHPSAASARPAGAGGVVQFRDVTNNSNTYQQQQHLSQQQRFAGSRFGGGGPSTSKHPQQQRRRSRSVFN